jgi:hypothetical protein
VKAEVPRRTVRRIAGIRPLPRHRAQRRRDDDTRPGGNAMATADTQTDLIPDDDVPEEPVPAMQQLLDNPFLLLFIGIAMPTVLYIVWGVMEIVGIPIAK